MPGAGAFVKVNYQGHTLDNMTYAAFLHGADVLGAMKHKTAALVPRMTQGSYTGAFGPSAGTHAGSGAFDLEPPTGCTHDDVQRAYRWAGNANWHRPPNWDGHGGIEHNHNILLGDPMVSEAGLKQVHDYYAGLNGLASHAADRTWHPNPILGFRYPLWVVSFHRVHDQATTARPKAIVGVRHIQRCLNVKRGAQLVVDGIYGPSTRAAYKRWEHQIGGDADGIPGYRGLVLLGASQFKVIA